ncbi:MAG: hypothetical protein GY940_33760, partial [bacterium]|nr:hypothetical protein [bacterium]
MLHYIKKQIKNGSGKKCIALITIFAFLFQLQVTGYAQSEDEIVKQFHRAKTRYINGQYMIARVRTERLISIINENGVDRKDILGMCYLILGAIYEKESK